jgi:hypothetical protein
MLQNAVNGILELWTVKNTAGKMGATYVTTPTYDEYTTLLISTASAYDDQFNAKKINRHVTYHEF